METVVKQSTVDEHSTVESHLDDPIQVTIDETQQEVDNKDNRHSGKDTDLVIVQVPTKQEIDVTEVTEVVEDKVAQLSVHNDDYEAIHQPLDVENIHHDHNDSDKPLKKQSVEDEKDSYQILNTEDQDDETSVGDRNEAVVVDTNPNTISSHNKDEQTHCYDAVTNTDQCKEHESIGDRNVEDMSDIDNVSVSGGTVNDNDSKEVELVIGKADKDELDDVDPADKDKDDTKSCFEQFVADFGKYLYVLLVLATISLIAVLIAFNEPDAESGIIIGLVWFVMILSGILSPLITVTLLKMWTKSTWFLVFFLIYFSLIVDIFAIGTFLKEIQIPLIIYGVVKILLIYHSYQFARIDGKFFIASIISEFLSMKFLKEDTQLYQLMYLYIAVLFIQGLVASLGCMAFVIDDIVSVPVYLIALVLFIWLNNTFRHFVTYMQCRLLAYSVSTKSVNNTLRTDPEFNPLKQSFHDALNKFTTIVIGSFLITTTPITYGITNLMQGIRIVTTGLVLCCAPCAEEDDEGNPRCCCIPHLIVIASGLTNLTALLVRKLSKWTLRVTAKTILIQAGFQNVTFWDAIKEQNKKVYTASKETFGSDMLFLDNCMLSTVTHLCILVSSIGALLTYMIEPNAAIICWIAGYIACRTMVEMIDVLLQFFLIAWFIEPRIIYDNQVLFEQLILKVEETLRTLYPNESEEFIKQQILELNLKRDTVTGVQKTTDPNHITNIEHTQQQINVVQETNVAVNTKGEIIAAQQNKAIEVNTETNDMNDADVNQLIHPKTEDQKPLQIR